MIYLVTNQLSLDTDTYKTITVEESLTMLSPLQEVGVDTETSGLSPWSDNLLLVQFGCDLFQIVVDVPSVSIMPYKSFLESNRTFLFWNAKFDLQWFYKYGIIVRNVYDGYLAEKLLHLGELPGTHDHSLKGAGLRYLNKSLDKSVRKQFANGNYLSDSAVKYAAEDVEFLSDIKEAQRKLIEAEELETALDIENRFVRVMAYIEWCGVRIDIEKWKQKIKKDEELRQEALDKCNKWIIENDPHSPYVYIDRQGDLFAENPFDTEPKVSINWDSPSQMVKLFEGYGVDLTNKHGKKSTESKVLKPQESKCGLIPLFLDFKEKGQVCKTFGEKFINQINPVSGRLHANWHSIGTDTGRVACGGSGNESINLLNIPSDAFTRSCFVADDGNAWISIDYSGQETYLMASIANDKAIIDELENGSGDMHSLVAYMVFRETIPRDFPIKKIKKEYHKERQVAKGYEF